MRRDKSENRFLGIKASSNNFHLAATDGKYPYLLLPPNLVEPSTLNVAVSRYLIEKLAFTRPKKDCNSSVAELELFNAKGASKSGGLGGGGEAAADATFLIIRSKSRLP